MGTFLLHNKNYTPHLSEVYKISETGTHEVPEGISIWELGTSSEYEKKAKGDYYKRTNKPKGYDPPLNQDLCDYMIMLILIFSELC